MDFCCNVKLKYIIMNTRTGLICLTIFILLQTISLNAQSNLENNKKNLDLSGMIELSISLNPTSALTDYEHVYVLKAVNKTNKELNVNVIANNINCNSNVAKQLQVLQKVYQSEFRNDISNISENLTLHANSNIEFYLKIINPPNSNLNMWNCTAVKAVDANTNSIILSNSLEIKSFMPDPKDFR